MRYRRGERATELRARIIERAPLLYADGRDAALDRPAYVRAASGCCIWGDRLVIVQDDAGFVALVDLSRGLAHGARQAAAIPLPAGPGGARQFDDLRGNKADKLDLESAFTAPIGGQECVIALGSGSRRERCCALVVRPGADAVADPTVELIAADDLFRGMRDHPELAGSELNLEGAALLPDGRVRLLQRGNGAAGRDLLPVEAWWDVPLTDLLVHLTGAGAAPRPTSDAIIQTQLGELDGVRLTFTDLAWSPRDARLWFLASAERSPDAVSDGEVMGSAIGVFDEIDGDTPLRLATLVCDGEAPARLKAEGLAFDPRAPAGEALVVLDADDPLAPAELCRVALSGPWLDR